MAEKDLVKENNRLHEKLDPRYKKVYENILTYIRVNTSAQDQRTQKALNTLLKQIIQAQREGKSIESVTGKNHKAYADKLVERLPKRNLGKLATSLAFILAGLNLAFDYLIQILFRLIDSASLTTTVVIMPFILEIVITASLGIGFVYTLFYAFRQVAFKDWPFWKEYGLYFLVGALFFFLYLLLTSSLASLGNSPSFEINIFLIVTLGIILLSTGIITFLNRK